ncbi:sensor histidine kinase [Ramlibacter tataouinensis]|uniref:histidine kinase n=1 Tax=Ramlibacter tataouinensis (strain ATCC BAA-407 / DSM 14655 / LMG 21543 / TTB310) TaxID=365046 RepID=F5Y0K9_RAMTT|nr:ATP-binding protein [Ramlibacter tataouinensis]AEG93415.1 candidate histidine kinase, classic [Ramlibacter tataouinensis TTB310]
MYSVLPALVSALFLGYGLYVVARKGFNRVSTSFFALCITTFFWQATWAVLFQVQDPVWADRLARFGYLLILFLPTSLYLFLVEISGRRQDRWWVALSSAVAAVLAVFNLAGDLFIAGHHRYEWGFYPRAGPLHPLHVLQTVVVVGRGLYITFRKLRVATGLQRVQLRLCVASLLVYFFAAVDYLCNYGFDFYPPGVVFVAISLGLIAVAVTRHHLMKPAVVAATVAHEMRTPLASIRMQADALSQMLPEIREGYELALRHGLVERTAASPDPGRLLDLSRGISQQVDRSNTVIEMMLASSRMEQIDTASFARHSMRACVEEALASYPFTRAEQLLVSVDTRRDFEFHGSDSLMVFVLFNLIKNSLYAIRAAGKGTISIELATGGAGPALAFTDTGCGIPAPALPRIFDTFFTTKRNQGAGIGLAFCRRVVESFGGRMRCESEEGRYTTFTLEFRPLPPAPAAGHGTPVPRPA